MAMALAEDPAVKIARNKFKNVLKHMVQEQSMHDEESDSDGEDGIYKYKLGRPSAGLSLQPRKRHKSGKEAAKKQHPVFVMKLFDRGVDLAQFNDQSPLYPICRAWIINKPYAPRPRKEPEDQDFDLDELDFRDETGDIYHLPPPEPLPYDEYGVQISYRVPAPLPRNENEEPYEINVDDSTAPSPAILFQNHLDRWNIIRHRWRQATAYNESRYGGSFAILRQIYERNRPEDATVTVTATEGEM